MADTADDYLYTAELIPNNNDGYNNVKKSGWLDTLLAKEGNEYVSRDYYHSVIKKRLLETIQVEGAKTVAEKAKRYCKKPNLKHYEVRKELKLSLFVLATAEYHAYVKTGKYGKASLQFEKQQNIVYLNSKSSKVVVADETSLPCELFPLISPKDKHTVCRANSRGCSDFGGWVPFILLLILFFFLLVAAAAAFANKRKR